MSEKTFGLDNLDELAKAADGDTIVISWDRLNLVNGAEIHTTLKYGDYIAAMDPATTRALIAEVRKLNSENIDTDHRNDSFKELLDKISSYVLWAKDSRVSKDDALEYINNIAREADDE